VRRAPSSPTSPATFGVPVAQDLTRPLAPGERYRCDGCGNVTRFDVVTSARTRRFLHFDLGGTPAVDEEEVLTATVEAVTCRWCSREDALRIEPAPATEHHARGGG
jgi:hypothetical protein